jgi:hypothetical protein
VQIKRSILFLFLLTSLAGCAVNPSRAKSTQGATNPEGYYALLATDDLGVGRERFAFEVIQPDGKTLSFASLVVHFYVSEQGEDTPEGDALATYQKMAVVPRGQEGKEAQGQILARGIYSIPSFNFDQAGTWKVTIQPNPSKTPFKQPISLEFQVAQHSATPAVGDPAPHSPTPVGTTPSELEAICSLDPPDDMHQVSADQVLATGHPFVIAFASPGFCRSRLCGPVTELVQSVEDRYRGRLDFIHVEPYDLSRLHNGGVFELVPAARAWGLASDPWVFVVDSAGRVAAKFEGNLSQEELDRAIEKVLQ